MSKNILITGTSSGFGRDAAVTLAGEGHHVFASMRAADGRNSSNAAYLRSKGIEVVELDVTSDDSVARGVDAVLQRAGHLDVVINNAGIGVLNVSEAFTVDQLREIYEVDVFGVQRVLRAVLPSLRARGSGLIVNVSSVFGRVVMPFFGLYCTSKFALEAMTDTYRYELSEFGIDVVSVQPSAYPTNVFVNALKPADADRVAAYGDLSALPAKIEQSISDSFKGESCPDPHDVSVAIAKLVEQADGTRPGRVVVGQAYGADHLNERSDAVQAQVLAGSGLSFLAQHPSSNTQA